VKGKKRELPKGWRWVKTTDIIDTSLKRPIRMGPFGSQLTKDEFVTEGIFVLGIEQVINKRFKDTGCKFITDEKFQQLKGFEVRHGDVLMTTMGTIGRTAVVPKEIQKSIISSHLIKISVGPSVHPEYIAWVLSHRSPVYRQLHAQSQGAIMQGLNTDIVKKLFFPLPQTRDEQIAVVSSLEQKMAEIENMQQAALKQKEAVEAMEAATFRDVFVSYKDSKWQPTSISKISDIIMGQSPDGSTYNKEGKGVPLLNGPTEFGAVYPRPVQWTTEPKKMCRQGDLIVCVRGNTTGKMNWADQEYCLGRGVAGIRGKEEKGDTNFVKYALQYKIGELLSGSERSTFPNLEKDVLKSFKVFAPKDLKTQEKVAFTITKKLNSIRQSSASINAQLEAIVAISGAILREVFDFEKN
jgi:type I restriction enzyme, S subunit